MPTYRCVPASKTVPPCPGGTAPDATTIVSNSQPTIYPAYFDHVPVQDLLVGIALVLSLIAGISSGRK